MFIEFAGAGTVARQVGEFLDGDFIGHLECELKIVRHLGDEAGEIFFVGKFVVGGVHANCLEGLGVFGQAIFLESRHGEFAAIDVMGFVVDQSAPARIFPTGRADENATGGEFGGFGCDGCAVEHPANVSGL